LRASDDDSTPAEKKGQLAFLPERTCAICYQEQNPTSISEADILGGSVSAGGVIGSAQTDITNPYETVSCGCIYCFVCVTEKLEAEEAEGWICLRCGEIVKQCKPWNGDVLEEARPSAGSGKMVGFAVAEESEKMKAANVAGLDADEEKTDSLQDVDTDGTFQSSNTWSTVERTSPDLDTSDTEMDGSK
jgi:peroxin-2